MDRAMRRVPPSNLEAEESVLGAVMLSVDAANTVMDRLHPGDFYQPSHQAIFEAVLRLYDANHPIDAITVAEQLRRQEELDRVGGVSYLTRLIDSVPTASNVDYYSKIVEEASLRRNLMRSGSEVSDLAFLIDKDISDVLDLAEKSVFSVADRRIGDGLIPVKPLLSTTLESIEALGEAGGQMAGMATGFKDLDAKLTGLAPGNLVIIAARPGMGKSALATSMAFNMAAEGHSIAMFTMEMSRHEVVQRLLCSVGRIDSMKLRAGNLTDRDWQSVARAAGRLHEAPIFIDDSGQLTVTEVRAKCRRMKRSHGLDLVVVDYLQLMSAGSRSENRQQEISEISRGLKALGTELDVPIVALSQLNRAMEQRQDKRPMLSDLRESGALEQDADIVMFIYRDEYYHPESVETRGIAEVNVAKHRAGATGMVRMTFLPEFTLFSDIGRDAM